MKKIIAFSLALAFLLFAGMAVSGTKTPHVLNARDGIQVCEDIWSDGNMHK